jgi:hypothetical protein
MTLDELRVLVAASSTDDWEPVGSPTFLGRVAETGDQAGRHFEPQEHGSCATYKPDIAVSIAWGLKRRHGRLHGAVAPEFPRHVGSEDAARLPLLGRARGSPPVRSCGRLPGVSAPSASGGARVGGRAVGAGIVGYWITRWQYDVFRIVDALDARERASIFDHYVQMAGFEIRDLNGGPWSS